jgi:hypothetical protein
MLTFEVASFLLKFMAVIHTAYATIKMPGLRGVITLKSDHCDALACENVTITHAGRFGKEEAQKTMTPRPSAGDTSKIPTAKQKQSMMITLASTQRTTDQLVADEGKGATDTEIQADPTDANKKLRISMELEAK